MEREKEQPIVSDKYGQYLERIDNLEDQMSDILYEQVVIRNQLGLETEITQDQLEGVLGKLSLMMIRAGFKAGLKDGNPQLEAYLQRIAGSTDIDKIPIEIMIQLAQMGTELVTNEIRNDPLKDLST
jgi:hypothetical protein